MPEIKAFHGIRYDYTRIGGDLSMVLAPPYDVLDQKDKNALLQRSERNIVAIDLPHIPPKSAGPAAVYDRSAALLNQWQQDGTLVREVHPALYVYHQVFTHGERRYTRRMLIACLRLVPFSAGSILPHEQTFGGPKEDRLALMKATRCNLSPIFGLYRDVENRLIALFADRTTSAPDAGGRLNDVDNRLWVVTDPDLVDAAARMLADRKVYIADGHHRYGTALLYRDGIAAESGGSIDRDHPANFVMFALASMDDAGCLILPYHRALPDTALSTLLETWAPATTEVAPEQADILLCDGRTGKQASLSFSNRDILASLESGQSPAWRKLDVAYLHSYLLGGLLKKKLGAEPKVRYVKSEDEAKRVAREEAGVAILLKAMPMEQLRKVSEAGGLMPQKSTFFYPKLATGLTINPLW